MSINLGLSVSDVIVVNVNMSPVGASVRNFGVAMFMGDSNVIDTTERLRLYTSLPAIASDIGSNSPEYLAAQTYFGQNPVECYIGRWARTATNGLLRGGILSAAQQALSNFTSIASGGLTITVDGTVHSLSALNFTAQTNLNGVASVVTSGLGAAATVTWDSINGRFNVQSATTGTSSSVSFATAPGSGADVSGLFGLTAGSGGYAVTGISAETALAALTVLAGMSNDWYGGEISASVPPSNSDYLACAQFIEGVTVSRIFGITVTNPAALDPNQSTDLASLIQAASLKRTFSQYSSTNSAVAASVLGRAFTVDFNGDNTTITVKFQQEPGVTPETLTETQAAALKAKNCNVFVKYNNNTAILQEGVMSNGFFFDEVYNADWLQNDIQTNVWNYMINKGTKVPQTDGGVTSVLNVVEGRLDQAVKNGMVAPGVWKGPPIGALNTGDTLSKGYYTYAPPISTQSDADRQARKLPVLQAAIKLAGAAHFVNVLVNVNR